jgi:hypothetical protein
MSVTFSTEKGYKTIATKLSLEIGDEIATKCIAEVRCHDVLTRKYKLYSEGSDIENYLVNSIAVHAMYGIVPAGIVDTTGCSISEGFEERVYKHIRKYSKISKRWLKTYILSLNEEEYDRLVERNQSDVFMARMANHRYSSWMTLHSLNILCSGYLRFSKRRNFINNAVLNLDNCHMRDLLYAIILAMDVKNKMPYNNSPQCKSCSIITGTSRMFPQLINGDSSSSSSSFNRK